jgi:hypothetical protein
MNRAHRNHEAHSVCQGDIATAPLMAANNLLVAAQSRIPLAQAWLREE